MTDIRRSVLEISDKSGKVLTYIPVGEKNFFLFHSKPWEEGNAKKIKIKTKQNKTLFSDTNQIFFRQTEGQKGLFSPGIPLLESTLMKHFQYKNAYA